MGVSPMTERVIKAEGATMKPSVSVAIALALLLSHSAMAQGVKRDILGLSLGLPLPEIAHPDVLASAGAWSPQSRPSRWATTGARGWTHPGRGQSGRWSVALT